MALRPEETLYQHGDRPELYYYSGHRPPSLLLWIEGLGDGWPAAEMLLERHLAALKSTRPDLIVVELFSKPSPVKKAEKGGLAYRLLARPQPIRTYHNIETVEDSLLPNYRSAEIGALEQYSGFRFYVLRGSRAGKTPKGEPRSWVPNGTDSNVRYREQETETCDPVKSHGKTGENLIEGSFSHPQVLPRGAFS